MLRYNSSESMPYPVAAVRDRVQTYCTGSEGAPASAQPDQLTQPAATGSSSSAPVEVDAAKPTTSLQIRLGDGSRLTGKSQHAKMPLS